MEQLKQRPIWVCCKIAEMNGRKTKIPCAAKGGATGTSKEYAHTWVTHDEAVAAMKKHGHTGVASTAAANCLSFIVAHFRKRYIHSFTPKRGIPL